MTAPFIKFPCGCEIGEFYVIAMCVSHVVELNQVKRELVEQKEAQERYFRAAIEAQIKGGK